MFDSLIRLDFAGVGRNFREFGDDVRSFTETGIANQSIQTFIDTLAAGVEPIDAFESTLADLGTRVKGMRPEEFEALAEQLVAMATVAGADPGQLRDLSETILVLGEDAGFSAVGVEILADVLLGPWTQAQGSMRVGDILAANQAASMFAMGQAAEESAPKIIEEATAFEKLAEAIVFDFDDVVSEFDLLIEKTTEAGEKVPATVAEMLADLRTQVDNQARLEAATTILESLGLGDLAADLRAEGPNALKAAEDFVADIESAFEAESLLDEGGTLGETGLLGFKQALADGDITPELLALAAEFSSQEIQSIIYLAGYTSGETYATGINAALIAAAITLDIPVKFLVENIDLGPGPFTPPAAPTPPTSGGGGNTVFSVVNEFTGFTPSSTDLAKASMITSSIIKASVT